jgi:formylglycine-generating enzyme required for sulfatase activity
LNELTGKNYRLVTEAEWEYAARGGNKSRGYKYSGSNNLDAVAWYEDNSDYEMHPVGRKAPNELGIYDMSGNVWEWCYDWWGDYTDEPQIDPTGPEEGYSRVLRGGSFNWVFSMKECRVSYRERNDPYYGAGFRIVLIP